MLFLYERNSIWTIITNRWYMFSVYVTLRWIQYREEKKSISFQTKWTNEIKKKKTTETNNLMHPPLVPWKYGLCDFVMANNFVINIFQFYQLYDHKKIQHKIFHSRIMVAWMKLFKFSTQSANIYLSFFSSTPRCSFVLINILLRSLCAQSYGKCFKCLKTTRMKQHRKWITIWTSETNRQTQATPRCLVCKIVLI